jgi:hypothetical protein
MHTTVRDYNGKAERMRQVWWCRWWWDMIKDMFVQVDHMMPLHEGQKQSQNSTKSITNLFYSIQNTISSLSLSLSLSLCMLHTRSWILTCLSPPMIHNDTWSSNNMVLYGQLIYLSMIYLSCCHLKCVLPDSSHSDPVVIFELCEIIRIAQGT